MAKDTCPALPQPVSDTKEVVAGWTIHKILEAISYSFGGAAIVVSLVLIFLHAFNMRIPGEQVKIMRITSVIPVFCALSMASVAAGNHSVSIKPWMDFYESLQLSSFFTLLCSYVGPDRKALKSYFSNLEIKDRKGNVDEKGGWHWFNKMALWVHQFVLVQIVVTIATIVTDALGVFCLQSNSVHYAHIWLLVVSAISVNFAVLAAIGFSNKLRKQITQRPIMKQLIAFKLIIFLNFIQSFGFSIAAGHITPTETLSYDDITVGIPNTLLCIELFLFSLFFHHAYSHRPYTNARSATYYGHAPKDINMRLGKKKVNPGRALLETINPIGIPFALREVLRARGGMKEAEMEGGMASGYDSPTQIPLTAPKQ